MLLRQEYQNVYSEMILTLIHNPFVVCNFPNLSPFYCCFLIILSLRYAGSMQYGFSSPFFGAGLGQTCAMSSLGTGFGGFQTYGHSLGSFRAGCLGGYGGMMGLGYGMGYGNGFGNGFYGGIGTGACGCGYGASMSMEPVATVSYATLPVLSYSLVPTYSMNSGYGFGGLSGMGSNYGLMSSSYQGCGGYGSFGAGYGAFGGCQQLPLTTGVSTTSLFFKKVLLLLIFHSFFLTAFFTGYSTTIPMVNTGFGYGGCIC